MACKCGSCENQVTQQAMPADVTPGGLERLERQLIPFLNTIRAMQGKDPIIVPTDKRIKADKKTAV